MSQSISRTALATAEAEGKLQVLILNTDRGVQSGASGYARICDYLPGISSITCPRRDPTSLTSRLATRVIRIGAANSWYRWGSLQMEWSALQRMKKEPADLLHILWGDQDWGHIHRFLKPETGLIITLHNPPEVLTENFPDPRVLKRVDHFILMAPSQSDFLHHHGIRPDQWTFIPHGIDSSAFSPAPQPREQHRDQLHVLHVGNYLRNFHDLAQVTRQLENEAIRFHIVCSHENRAAHDYGAGCEWHHNISDKALLELYRSCDVNLLTATGATANNALLEAMSCGLPLLAQNVGGIRDYTTPDCAVLTPPNAPGALALALLDLAEDPAKRRRMADAALHHATGFAWPAVADLTARVYRRAAATRTNRFEQR